MRGVVGLLAFAARDRLAPHDDPAGREVPLFAQLRQEIPAAAHRADKRWGDEAAADVRFGEGLLVHGFRSARGSYNTTPVAVLTDGTGPFVQGGFHHLQDVQVQRVHPPNADPAFVVRRNQPARSSPGMASPPAGRSCNRPVTYLWSTLAIRVWYGNPSSSART